MVRVGLVEIEADSASWDEIAALAAKEEVVLACVDAAAEARMKEEVDAASKAGDTVNGVFEVVTRAVPALASAPTPTGMSAASTASLHGL